jgi:hypothetical protein
MTDPDLESTWQPVRARHEGESGPSAAEELEREEEKPQQSWTRGEGLPERHGFRGKVGTPAFIAVALLPAIAYVVLYLLGQGSFDNRLLTVFAVWVPSFFVVLYLLFRTP